MSQYSNHLAPHTYYRGRLPIRSRTSTSTLREPTEDLNDSSPCSTEPANSPQPHPASTRSSSYGSDSEPLDLDDDKEPASGPQRPRSASGSKPGAKAEKEKRKRSRVTPEQLVHLERYFVLDRSPPAARRREISERLGMQERQTQIWFQNRRAKAKLQDGRTGRSNSLELPPDSPPQLSTGFEVGLQNLLHEAEPVTIIPCTDLSIGAWRRIATTIVKHDLVAYVCDARRRLVWFIHSGGLGFKMEIPFDTIIDAEFTNTAPGTGLASFLLSQPPLFFLEHVSSPRPDGSTVRLWKTCSDWTEGHQASQVLRHDLIGSAAQLSHFLDMLRAGVRSDMSTRAASSYRTAPAPPTETPRPNPAMALPLPPTTGLAGTNLSGPGYHYNGSTTLPPSLGRNDVSRKRLSHTGAGLAIQSSDNHNQSSALSHGVPILESFPHQPSYAAESPRRTLASASSSSSFDTHVFNNHAPETHDIGHNGRRPSRDNHLNSAIPLSHDLASRTYPTISNTFYDETSSMMSHTYPTRQSYGQSETSPPLLTTPYHPPPHILGNVSSRPSDYMVSASTPVVSGLPSIAVYEDHYR